MPSIISDVICTLLSLNSLASLTISPLIFDILFAMGICKRTIPIPTIATHPKRIIKRIVIPAKVTGKANDQRIVINLVYMMLRSFESRLVILPNSDDFITKDVIFDILLYSNMARDAFIWEAR